MRDDSDKVFFDVVVCQFGATFFPDKRRLRKSATCIARPPTILTLPMRSRAESPRVPAVAYYQGTPVRTELEARDLSRLGDAIKRPADGIAARFSSGEVDGKIQAHVLAIQR